MKVAPVAAAKIGLKPENPPTAPNVPPPAKPNKAPAHSTPTFTQPKQQARPTASSQLLSEARTDTLTPSAPAAKHRDNGNVVVLS
jgi:hypothetical protein